jgi:hypothetical protein
MTINGTLCFHRHPTEDARNSMKTNLLELSPLVVVKWLNTRGLADDGICHSAKVVLSRLFSIIYMLHYIGTFRFCKLLKTNGFRSRSIPDTTS